MTAQIVNDSQKICHRCTARLPAALELCPRCLFDRDGAETKRVGNFTLTEELGRGHELGLGVHWYADGRSFIPAFVADPGGPLSYWIDRVSATEFEFYYQRGAQPRVVIGRGQLDAVEQRDLM